jgi:UDP-N-acetylmuramate--alanine ligase
MTKAALPSDLKGVHIHCVGIKGTGMAALVEILYSRGAVITGSDVSERFYTDDILDKLRLTALPFSSDNITGAVEYVIYSSAYNPEKNPDLQAAVKKNIPCLMYTEALGQVSEQAYSCGICGVHGKTTTTGLTGTLLEAINLPAQVLAGSVITSFGNSCTLTTPSCAEEGHRFFVAETCEYQRHFMSFFPKKIVLTSVESDHQDYYPTYESIRDAFVDYACKLPQYGQLIYCADDPGAVETALLAHARRNDIELIPYGEKAAGPYKLVFGPVVDGRQYFSAGSCDGLAISVPGHHMVRNATAAYALVSELLKTAGKDPDAYRDTLRQGLLQFTGGKRRSEIIGTVTNMHGDSVIFIDDYGHHPTAIKTTLSGYREFYRGRKIIVDFMSHTYSRTAALLDDFAGSFAAADEVILHKIYASARENSADAPVTGETLFERTAQHHKKVSYFPEVLDAESYVLSQLNQKAGAEFPDGYVFVTMGAGDNWKIGKAVCQKMGSAGTVEAHV